MIDPRISYNTRLQEIEEEMYEISAKENWHKDKKWVELSKERGFLIRKMEEVARMVKNGIKF